MKTTDKKTAILDTALRLFVEQGFHTSSTAQIAKQAGVATGTLFHHFPTKEALMKQLFLNVKQEFADAIRSNIHSNADGQSQHNIEPGDELKTTARNLWFAALEWAANHPLKQQFFQLYSLSPIITTELRDQAMNTTLGFIAELIKQGQTLGVIQDYPLKLMQDNCHGQFLAAISYFSDNPEYWQLPAHKEASFMLFWNAIAKPQTENQEIHS
ncbi:TetR/AcrR family transcriptional regulator [Shewanella sp. AS1]|uniref:TetR/AcrR family transcriptional regulator n=1 Tax=Shewanella sp. AS1 TaxID=2907626 RepID=UPI001F3468F5|nr:TetR/AcrR family transcriptional regulator [Shewanella sp. AS1]MCE9677799.1 TetR/AcrR family transcriptional regulator [Shewanella sp. AS1]